MIKSKTRTYYHQFGTTEVKVYKLFGLVPLFYKSKDGSIDLSLFTAVCLNIVIWWLIAKIFVSLI